MIADLITLAYLTSLFTIIITMLGMGWAEVVRYIIDHRNESGPAARQGHQVRETTIP